MTIKRAKRKRTRTEKTRAKKSDNDASKLMLAYLCVSTEGPEASLVRKVKILDRFNLTDAEIAKVCSSTVQSIRNARQFAKKER
jgi:hypothetical protein